jgi:hypothetical protein
MQEEITGSSFLRMTGYGAPARWHKRTVAHPIVVEILLLCALCIQMPFDCGSTALLFCVLNSIYTF